MLRSLSFCSWKPKNVCAKGTFTMGSSGAGEEHEHGNKIQHLYAGHLCICCRAVCVAGRDYLVYFP